MKKIDITGQRFGRLVVLHKTRKRCCGHIIWLCKCVCGKLVEVLSSDLRSGRTKSCGCLWKEVMTIHGDNRRGKISRLYSIWENMKSRCLNPKRLDYKYYGGRGIKICKEWKNSYTIFKNWALANRYRDDLTIDRVDNNRGYCPENCHWVSLSENLKNKNFRRKKC